MKVKDIFIHCSAKWYGDVLSIDKWHREIGWSCVGYHFVILNGRPNADTNYIEFLDGQIQPGRQIDDDPLFEPKEIGAHVRGRNLDSVGICLIGRRRFTDKQLESTKKVCLDLIGRFGLRIENILGHREDPRTSKTCPNIPMFDFRDYVNEKLDLKDLQVKIGQHISSIYGERM